MDAATDRSGSRGERMNAVGYPLAVAAVRLGSADALGLALPQYDYSVNESVLRWDSDRRVRGRRRARRLRLVVALRPPLPRPRAVRRSARTPRLLRSARHARRARARSSTRPRLGTLVMCEALRPASVLAKSLATLDRICDGRLDVGLGAGWYEPDYTLIGMDMPPPKERLARLREAIEVCRGSVGRRPVHVRRALPPVRSRRTTSRARCSDPTPPIIVGGKGDRLLALVAELADGWNTCWVVDARRLPRASRRARTRVRGDRPRSGDRDAIARPLRAVRRGRGRSRPALRAPAGPEPARCARRASTLDEWREGRLVGTVEQVREQAAGWADLGIETLVVGDRGGSVRRHHASTTWNCSPTAIREQR